MKYINLFETKADYDNARLYYPNVSYVESTDKVMYQETEPEPDYSKEYLTFEALQNGTFTLTINQYLSSYDQTYVAYSIDNGTTWTTTAVDNTNQTITTPTITAGNKVLWKGEGYRISKDDTYGSNFSSTGNFNIEGNIMSLLYGDNFEGQTTFLGVTSRSGSAFCNLFKSCTKLKSIENIVMPVTTLLGGCYKNMFRGCTGLTTVPSDLLPATTMLPNCYDSMFLGCSSLTTVPELPATTLVTGCYQYMFYGCTSLTTVPSNLLPSMTLATDCYSNMFSGCTRLTTAPALPATNGGNGGDAYANMFKNCTALTTAPELPAMTSTGWYCYHDMFNGCSSLNYIKAMFTITPGANYTNNWVNGVAATGTFVKNAEATWDVSGTSGIPTGWTVQNYSPAPTSIAFDLATYSGSGTEYEAGQYINFVIFDENENDVSDQCTYEFSPSDTGITVTPNGDFVSEFDFSDVAAGNYSITVTATLGNLSTTSTINLTIA